MREYITNNPARWGGSSTAYGNENTQPHASTSHVDGRPSFSHANQCGAEASLRAQMGNLQKNLPAEREGERAPCIVDNACTSTLLYSGPQRKQVHFRPVR